MLKQLRSNTKWIMVTVVICFVAMMVFAWGMDITSRQRGAQAGFVAIINGESIPYTYYDQLIRNQTQSYESSQRLSMDQLRVIHNQVWDFIVTNTLVNQLTAKRGITFSDQELMQYILDNPIQQAEQVSIFQDNGQFSIDKYRAFIQDPQNLQNEQTRQLLDYIETQARSVMPVMRLQEDLLSSIVVTDAAVRERWLEENETRRIDFLQVTPADIKNTPAVDQAALQNYYQEHREDYRLPAQSAIQSVFFELAPTAQDTAMVKEQAAMLAQRARTGDDFAELANSYTEDPGNTDANGQQLGGDLGWFSKGQMVAPFDEAVFKMKPSEVSDPVETPYGLHVIKVDSLKYAENGKDVAQVKARHILLRLEPSGETQQNVDTQVQAFHEAVAGGADFAAEAKRLNLPVQQSPLFTQDSLYLPGIGTNAQILINRIFRAKAGDILPVSESDRGSYVIRVSARVKEGISPFEDVRDAVTSAYLSNLRKNYARDFVSTVADQVQQGKTLQEAVTAVHDTTVTVTVSTQDVNRAMTLPNMESHSPLIAQVFKRDQAGSSTGAVETAQGYGIAVLLEKIPIDEAEFEQEKSETQQQLVGERQNQIMSDFLAQLRDSAKIVDNRDQFLSL